MASGCRPIRLTCTSLGGDAVRVNRITKKGRLAAESLMSDTLRITRKSAEPVTDPNTGKVTYPAVMVYEGRGRVQANALQDREVAVGGADFNVGAFTVQAPFDVDLHGDDEAEVLASRMDARMVGRTFRIDTVPRKTHATMMRAGAEEVT